MAYDGLDGRFIHATGQQLHTMGFVPQVPIAHFMLDRLKHSRGQTKETVHLAGRGAQIPD